MQVVCAGQRPHDLRSVAAPGLVTLIEECTALNPKKRPSISECVERLKLATNQKVAPPSADARSDGADLISSQRQSSSSSYGHVKNSVDQKGASALVANGPSVEQCDDARGIGYERLGRIDAKMLVGGQQHHHTVPFYIVHRANGNVALASRGLADPPHFDPTFSTGIGIELWGEADEAEVGTGQALGSTYLFQMMHEVDNESLIRLLLNNFSVCVLSDRWRATRDS